MSETKFNIKIFFFQIRAKQEQLLKVRNFLPPQAQEPEIFLLEKLIEKQVESKISNGDLFGDREGKTWKQNETQLTIGPMSFVLFAFYY